MNRIDRLMGIVTFLQSKKYVTAENLSKHFSISVRTVYRDIKSLEELGIPIGFENKMGYFITQGFFLPPVSLNTDEANALVLVESLVKRFSDKSVLKNYQSALNKIKSVINFTAKDQMEDLDSHISIHIPFSNSSSSDYLSAIQTSIINKSILTIKYKNNSSEISIREIEPIGLVFYALNWHIIAWCWKRGEYRDFKLPGIQNLKDNNEEFRIKKHISINDYIDFIIKKYSKND